jgi:hypothetical protein
MGITIVIHAAGQDIDVLFLPDYVCKSLDNGNSEYMAIATGRDLSALVDWLRKNSGSPAKYVIQQGYNNPESGILQIYVKFRYKQGEPQFNSEVKKLAMSLKLTWHNKEWKAI